MKIKFPSKSIKTLFKREKKTLFPAKPENSDSCIRSCKKCDICKKYLITDNKLSVKCTGRFYNVRGKLSCNSSNTFYFISCKNCEDQYIGSTIDFKARLRILESDLKSKKDRCGPASYFHTKC